MTRAQKAAQTRMSNAEGTDKSRAKKEETIVITADQFMAAIKKFTEGFEALSRIESLLSEGNKDRAPESPLRDEKFSTAIADVKLASTPPVSVLVDDVHSRSSSLRFRAESLRDAIINGVSIKDGEQVMRATESFASQGPTKDGLNFAFSNMCAVEDCLNEIDRYLLNR